MQAWLPPQLWPAPLQALPAPQRALLAPPWPDVWIANGRRSIPYSLWIKAEAPSTFVVQLQDPKLDPALFDLVAPPQHDGLSGPNVISTLGAPVWTPLATISATRAGDAARQPWDPPVVLVIIGGTSKRHQLSSARTTAMIKDLQALTGAGASLRITTSRRTPESARATLRAFAAATGSGFFDNERDDGPNPYQSWLATSDAALVTEDSTNMITDAAFYGLPVHLLKLDGGDAKFDRLHQALIQRGVARWFDGQLQQWEYSPVRDSLAVANRIRMDLEIKSR